MKTQFTPGPWDSMYSPGPWCVDGSETTNRVGVKDVSGKTVCTMRPCVNDFSNSKLIAAALDLLAAGDRCLQALAANGVPNCEAAKEMRAALAKAKQS